VSAQELLVEARMAIGQESEAIIDIERVLADHPFHERLWEQLMLALYRCGRQVDAVESYHQIRRMLDTELGLEPGPGLRSRLREILNHEPGLHATKVLVASSR
jgi:DNA-binding SARP family transcriptional activator